MYSSAKFKQIYIYIYIYIYITFPLHCLLGKWVVQKGYPLGLHNSWTNDKHSAGMGLLVSVLLPTDYTRKLFVFDSKKVYKITISYTCIIIS